MSPKFKKAKFSFTFRHLFRLLIFIAIYYFLLTYLSGKTQTSLNLPLPSFDQIGNSLYQQIPPKSRQQLENFNQSPPALFIQDKIDFIKTETQDFPQKQIKDFQKWLVSSLAQELLDKIEKK
ncbi:hypothetical protein A3K55_00675 [Candidatus Shapirobacteria bacterium RBG_13_44_7]|uniref:Uncharacterized protein n=1 Tax=Candidatus Shapirobacteria bacterium RBG_13_44_7 TaxID=1802149 RepID=A0A1F7SG99_9BACT|nr:MAG: hypothetical protein A3K55_00675 [Candidatus Shapirobacteria bacterium RBG_13_44_7]